MSEQISLTARTDFGLPPLAISGAALARFTIEMAMQLQELEQRFAEPRQHPRLIFEASRGVSRRPR